MNRAQMDVMNSVELMDYPLELELGGDDGDVSEASLTINSANFALLYIQHMVIGDDGTDAMQYSIDWSIQNIRRFWKGTSAPMALSFGNPRTSIWKMFRKPVRINEQVTVYVKLTNRYGTTGVAARKIQIIFSGYERRADQ